MQSRQRVLILPGWQNSGATHWQSRWQALHGFERVVQSDWDWPRRGDWMARLEETLLADPRPTALVAHSLGCHLVAAWAAHSALQAHITGALLVAPPDVGREDLPPQLSNWRGAVRQRLPFPAVLVYSSDDPFCDPAASLALAASWGAEAVSLGAAGHINGDSGLGDWPRGPGLACAGQRRPALRSTALRALAVGVAVAAVAGLLQWWGVGLQLLLVITSFVGIVAWLFPAYGVRLLDGAIRFVRGLYWAREEGHFHSFGGVPLQVEDDGRHVWLGGPGLLRVLGRNEPMDVLAARMPGQWQRDGKGTLMLRVDAVVQYLAHMPERNNPRVQRLRRYLERELLYPAEQRHKRG